MAALTLCRTRAPLSATHLPRVVRWIRSRKDAGSLNAQSLLTRFGKHVIPVLRDLLRSDKAAELPVISEKEEPLPGAEDRKAQLGF